MADAFLGDTVKLVLFAFSQKMIGVTDNGLTLLKFHGLRWRGRSEGRSVPPSHVWEDLSVSHRLGGSSLVECGIGKLECLDRRRSFEHI